ncbi:MAG: hypothetical protein PHR28_08830, partial [candidate division Zixibacteria bacterium]|nr:hypothetical protein [candidate division Zixibacteria bacterium]
MTRSELLDRMEDSLTRLVEGMLAEKNEAIDFLTELDRLDDIEIDLHRGIEIDQRLTRFFADHTGWMDGKSLMSSQKSQAGALLKEIGEALSNRQDEE